ALFAESNSRFLAEVAPDKASAFEDMLDGHHHAIIGTVTQQSQLTIHDFEGKIVAQFNLQQLTGCWKSAEIV
ncbi:MAG: hypothetical protein P1S60_08805, partial [Anaerolineae bacterium]|nr:hypothetical protein [Anaerolineae bacterium]